MWLPNAPCILAPSYMHPKFQYCSGENLVNPHLWSWIHESRTATPSLVGYAQSNVTPRWLRDMRDTYKSTELL